MQQQIRFLVLVFASLLMLSACQRNDGHNPVTELEKFATRYAEAWSSRDPEMLGSFYAENGTLRINGGEPSVGRDAVTETARSYMTAFPDMVVRLVELRETDGAVEFHWHWTGTNTGPGGIGNAVDLRGYEQWTLDDAGLILMSNGYFDNAEYQRQMSPESAFTKPSPGQRVILVTGSTGGLGRETALALARQGDHVIIHGRNQQRATEVLREIVKDGRGSARFYRADLGSLRETKRLAEMILADYDRLDVLVNNAGVFLPNTATRQVTADGYELHFQVNYLAGYVLTNLLLPLLETSAPSRVVNVASGQKPLDFEDLMLEKNYDGMEAYLRSKNAQIMMTFAMAPELAARNIAINALFPSGLMDTDMVIEAGFEPESSVETGRDALLQVINDDIGTGKFFNVFEVGQAIPQASDADAQRKLLQASARLSSVPYFGAGK